MTKSEKQRIVLKEREWKSAVDVFFDRLRVSWPKWTKRFKKTMKYIFNWYFFYNKKDKALHIIEWCFATVILLRFFGLI